MNRVSKACALAALSLAPAICLACDGMDASSASVRTPEKMAASQAPAASKVAVAPAASKARALNATKPTAVKVKSAPDQKLAANATN